MTTRFENLWHKVQELFESLEQSQERRVWKVANRINPRYILDDLLNPQDSPELVSNPEFNFEDGQLSGLRSARIAINSLIKDYLEAEKNLQQEPNVVHVPLTQDSRTRVYKAEPWGWNIRDCHSDEIWSEIQTRMKPDSEKQKVVVFDLDGTLFDVGHRTIAILKEWLTLNNAKIGSTATLNKLATIQYDHVGYSLAHCFENIGLNLREQEIVEIFSAAERLWKERFFDGKTLVEHDVPVEGAVQFAHRCAQAGLKLVYLSGRFDKVMRSGTETQLSKAGFPLQNFEIVLKPDSSIEDAVFKEQAFEQICSRYNVLGNFENEYVNLSSMVLTNQHAVHVIVDTHHSGRPVAPLKHLVYRLSKF